MVNLNLTIVCLAQLASYYYKKSFPENDYQPDFLEEDIGDKNNGFVTNSKKIVQEKSCKVMIKRNQRFVLRFYQRNKYLHRQSGLYHLTVTSIHF